MTLTDTQVIIGLTSIVAGLLVVIVTMVWAFMGWIVRRFDHIDGEFKRIEAKTEAKFDRIEAKFEERFSRIDAKLDRFETKFESKFDRIDAKIDALRSPVKA